MKNSTNPLVNSIYLGLRDWNVLAGRATRPQFWFFLLALLIFSSLAPVIAFVLDLPFVLLTGFGPFSLAALLVSLALVVPSVTITVRRLHDAGSSPAWAWVGLAVSLLVWPVMLIGVLLVVGGGLALAETTVFAGIGVILLATFIALGYGIFLLVLLVKPSSPLDSKYGPAPQPAPPAPTAAPALDPGQEPAALPGSEEATPETGQDRKG